VDANHIMARIQLYHLVIYLLIIVQELMNKSDHDLFCKLCAPTHALNHLLPPRVARSPVFYGRSRISDPLLPPPGVKPPGRTNLPYSVRQIVASLRRHYDT